MSGGIGPGLRTAFVIGMPKQTRRRIVQMPVIDQDLFGRFVIRVLAVAKHLAIAHQKWERHENAVCPELPLAAGRFGMPEASIFCARISIEDLANILGGELVLLLL